MYTYQLIDGGYEIFQNGVKIIYQPHSPNGLNKLSTDEAEKLAKYICKKLEFGGYAGVSVEEQLQVVSMTADDEITQFAQQKAEEEKQLNAQSPEQELYREIEELKKIVAEQDAIIMDLLLRN